MNLWTRFWLAGAAVAVGALTAPAAAQAATVTVNLSLTRYQSVGQIDAGPVVGVSPARIVVRVGDSIVFVNQDSGGRHTATGLTAARGRFPSDPRFTDAALAATGTIGAGAWSTGELAPGARSRPIAAEHPGTYLFGCFYDYSAGMRGEIIVEP